jgi:purine-binding chemotaxis protein CheW
MSDQIGVPAVKAQPTPLGGQLADADAANGVRRVEFVSFAIGDDQYGVDVMAVREIKVWNPITHLPEQPDHMRGVLNLRGVIVPIIDLRCRLGEGLTDATAMHVVIVVQIGSQAVGLLADRVLDIVSIARDQVQPVPRISKSGDHTCLSGLVTVEAQMIALLDVTQLLSQTPSEGAPPVPKAA